MNDWTFPKDKQRAKKLLAKGYSISAVAMLFGAVGTNEYYTAYKELGFELSKGCPYYGSVCFGTGDCNCQEE